jgi:hypothetical protein
LPKERNYKINVEKILNIFCKKMKNKIIIAVMILFLLCVAGIMAFINKQPLKVPIRSFLSYEKESGIVPYDSLKWCNFPISHDLDKGGIPDDLQDIQHPSVCYVENGWNGANVWMCATPYPQALKPYSGEPWENACIFFANSDEKAPTDFSAIYKNPIIYKGSANFNSDSDIFFDDADSTMYCLTRPFYTTGKRTGNSGFVLQSSKDGQHWSEPVNLFIINKTHAVSPCLIKYKDKYRIYIFIQKEGNHARNTGCIDIYESESLKEPNFVLYKSVKWDNDVNVWHGDILQYKDKLLLVGCGMKNNIKTRFGFTDHWRYLYLGVSNDGENFKMINTPLLQSPDVYRSTGYIDNENLNIYVSFLSHYFNSKEKYMSGSRIGMINMSLNTIDTLISSR